MPIINQTQQTKIANYVEMADNPFKRMKGLIGRTSLAEGHALVIKPCTSIHMFFMKFPIDVIFADKFGRVVGLVHDIKPSKVSPVFWKSSCAIELPAGTIISTKTQLYDQLSISHSW